jgi:hypothetical protein
MLERCKIITSTAPVGNAGTEVQSVKWQYGNRYQDTKERLTSVQIWGRRSSCAPRESHHTAKCQPKSSTGGRHDVAVASLGPHKRRRLSDPKTGGPKITTTVKTSRAKTRKPSPTCLQKPRPAGHKASPSQSQSTKTTGRAAPAPLSFARRPSVSPASDASLRSLSSCPGTSCHTAGKHVLRGARAPTDGLGWGGPQPARSPHRDLNPGLKEKKRKGDGNKKNPRCASGSCGTRRPFCACHPAAVQRRAPAGATLAAPAPKGGGECWPRGCASMLCDPRGLKGGHGPGGSRTVGLFCVRGGIGRRGRR